MQFIEKIIIFQFKPALAFWVFLGFVGFTIIGTLTHEMGHIAFAKALGNKTHLGYGYMTYFGSKEEIELLEIYERNEKAIRNKETFAEASRRDELAGIIHKNSFWITLGGPLQTMLTGTIGFLLVYRRKDKINEEGLRSVDWILVFLSLFWLRELFNLMTGVIRSIVQGHFNPFKGRSDEIRLARHLDIWEGSISLPLGIIALAVGLYVIFKILPKPLRFSFIVAGFLGGIFGFWFWLVWLGSIVMP